MTIANQQENLDFFNAELPKLLANPLIKNKFIVIYNLEITGSFDTFDSALKFALTKYQASEFIIQQAIEIDSTINFLYSAMAV